MIKEVTQTHFAQKHTILMFYVMRLAFVQGKMKIGIEKSDEYSALGAFGISGKSLSEALIFVSTNPQ